MNLTRLRICSLSFALLLVLNNIVLGAAETDEKKEARRAPRQRNEVVFILPIERVNLASTMKEGEHASKAKVQHASDKAKATVYQPIHKELPSLSETSMVSVTFMSAGIAFLGTIVVGFAWFYWRLRYEPGAPQQRLIDHHTIRSHESLKGSLNQFQGGVFSLEASESTTMNNEAAMFAKQLRKNRSEFQLASKMKHQDATAGIKKKIQTLQRQRIKKGKSGALAKKLGLGKGEVELSRRLQKLNNRSTTQRGTE